ncbi:hypothetical protein HMPREF1588_00633 [Escherichia coli 110957]|uniref:Uncharacterized protein n=1 Tax=Escherichia coli TaxID=562 RepID=A0A0D4D990_ECOLX|nr:hypothetical protein [Escherichia coli]ESA78806.1 hypothetical protein HMPREF1588_00633 [Escherichia coli 110957]
MPKAFDGASLANLVNHGIMPHRAATIAPATPREGNAITWARMKKHWAYAAWVIAFLSAAVNSTASTLLTFSITLSSCNIRFSEKFLIHFEVEGQHGLCRLFTKLVEAKHLNLVSAGHLQIHREPRPTFGHGQNLHRPGLIQSFGRSDHVRHFGDRRG